MIKKQLPDPLPPMPEKPTLVDFFNLRFEEAQHVMQSAARAMRNGVPEDIVFACLLHDTGMALQMPDHGYVGAALYEPYVDEKVSWAIRYHQALRFFPDPDYGYEYPALYYDLFGKDFVPEPYIQRDYAYAKKHKWYEAARLVTLNDEYSFDKSVILELDPFIDIIGRNFKQPAEGLGRDNTPSSWMWRTIINPTRPL
jgi:hypothetical protein